MAANIAHHHDTGYDQGYASERSPEEELPPPSSALNIFAIDNNQEVNNYLNFEPIFRHYDFITPGEFLPYDAKK